MLVISALLYAVDARLLTARHLAERMREQYAADAGVEYALNRLMLSPNCGTPGAVTTFVLPAPVNGLSPTISVRCAAGPVAGGSWVTQTIGTQNLLDVYFLDALNGWAVGSDGTIYHTTDGGLTWSIQTESPQFPPAKDIEGVVFKDANCGWSVGEGNKKSIQWTTNGGVTWYLTEKEQTGDLYAVTYDHTSWGGSWDRAARSGASIAPARSPNGAPQPFRTISTRLILSTARPGGWRARTAPLPALPMAALPGPGRL